MCSIHAVQVLERGNETRFGCALEAGGSRALRQPMTFDAITRRPPIVYVADILLSEAVEQPTVSSKRNLLDTQPTRNTRVWALSTAEEIR